MRIQIVGAGCPNCKEAVISGRVPTTAELKKILKP